MIDPGEILDDLRLYKDDEELERLRRAAAVTAEGVGAAMRAVRAGAGEWELEATLESVFRRAGADGPGYSGLKVSGSLGRTAPGTEPPHHVWEVSPALSGMAFHSGTSVPAWKGDLFLGALAKTALIRLDLDGDRVLGEERLLEEFDLRIRDVREGPDGALWLLVDEKDGKLMRLSPVTPAPVVEEPAAAAQAAEAPPADTSANGSDTNGSAAAATE